MKRIITTQDGQPVVITENGVSTITSIVMKLKTQPALKTYNTVDEHSGVNKELLTDVLAEIHANREWWQQGSWRTFTEDPLDQWELGERAREREDLKDPETLQAFIASSVAYNPDETEPACGTAMCFAGWVGELTRVDWVVDAATIRQARKDVVDIRAWDDCVLTRREENPREPAEWLYIRMDTFSGRWLDRILRERGFTPKTHRIRTISTYAAETLGIGSDPLDLFDGDNSLERVEQIVQVYLEATKPLDDIEDNEWDNLEAELVR